MIRELYSESFMRRHSVHLPCSRFAQPLVFSRPCATWQSTCCVWWQRLSRPHRWWCRGGARPPCPGASHDIHSPDHLSRYPSPSHSAMTGIWSEDGWPRRDDTVKQTANTRLLTVWLWAAAFPLDKLCCKQVLHSLPNMKETRPLAVRLFPWSPLCI